MSIEESLAQQDTKNISTENLSPRKNVQKTKENDENKIQSLKVSQKADSPIAVALTVNSSIASKCAEYSYLKQISEKKDWSDDDKREFLNFSKYKEGSNQYLRGIQITHWYYKNKQNPTNIPSREFQQFVISWLKHLDGM